MAWQLLSIWFIVIATIVWFVWEERQARLRRLAEQARLYATGAAWRHRGPPRRKAAPAAAQRDITEIQRRFIDEVRRQNRLTPN